jgi:hypothetical protein
MSTGALFHDEMSETTGVGVTHCNIGASARPMVAFSGFYESPGPPLSGDARGIVLTHRHGHRNGQQRGGACCSSLCSLCSWRPLGRYGASSCPLAEFSGFYESPGPP